MTRFIENVNVYLSQMKIKQAYICMKTGIDSKKLSRILTGVQDINSADMEKIADALGQKMEFFLTEAFHVPEINKYQSERIAFYAGDPTKKQEETARRLFELMENIDVVLSAKGRFRGLAKEI